MSSEVHKHIEKRIVKNESLFKAEVINFPSEKKVINQENLKVANDKVWNISDKSNEDQLKALIGVCFMFGVLIVMGLYSNLT